MFTIPEHIERKMCCCTFKMVQESGGDVVLTTLKSHDMMPQNTRVRVIQNTQFSFYSFFTADFYRACISDL